VPWRPAVVLVLVALLAPAGRGTVHAHAALRLSDPSDGATLRDSPAAIRLTFTERPDTGLSDIRVIGTAGTAFQIDRPVTVPGDALSISIQLQPLDRGVYTVSWRIVSAVDGHATTGTYAFGVGTDPGAAAPASATSPPAVSLVEIIARWVLITGLVGLLGGAVAGVGRFGGTSDVAIGAAGCLLALVGVTLLAVFQTRNAGVSFANLLDSAVGQSLVWRFAAAAVAGIALFRAWRQRPDDRRLAMAVVLLAALTAVALHVAGGHAAASDRWPLAMLASQWVHFAAVGIWLGGLPPLLLGVHGAPSASKADAVGRFSILASVALVVVTLTGIARAAGELSAWGDLTSTAYGQAVLAKIALTVGIAAFAAVNHWRNVAAAVADLRPLRRAGSGEVALAACALGVAAALGSTPPPAAASADQDALVASAADFGTTLRVRLTARSDRPGPNRFAVAVTDYDSGEPLNPRSVSLRFTPLDDARIASSTLEMSRGQDESFIGSGSHLAFDGRWRITALIEREGDSVEVPMDVRVIESDPRAAPP
jgi:copper transport protein